MWAYSGDVEGVDHTVTVAGRQTDALITAIEAQRLATVDLSEDAPEPDAWPREARLAAVPGQIPGQIADLMGPFNAGTLSVAVVFPQVQALETEQATLEAERPAAPLPAPDVSADALPDLDVDRQRAVDASLIDAVVVATAPHRGAQWSPDRIADVMWRG